MYNPPGPDDTLEWIELHNQMTVDIDLSEWSIQGGVEFEFPAGTTLPGGGYLVVARAPAVLAAATGFADAMGPLGGQLANGGEQLTLHNKGDRVMDAVDYRDDDPWPVGADGSGATLAKIDQDFGSSQPSSWTTSRAARRYPWRGQLPVIRSDPREIDRDCAGRSLGLSCCRDITAGRLEQRRLRQ